MKRMKRWTAKRNPVDERLKDAGPVAGPQSLSSVELAATSGMSSVHSTTTIDTNRHSERKYPKQLDSLAQFINEPGFPTSGYHFYHNTKAYATSYLSYNSNIIMKGLSFELLMSLIHLNAGLHS